MVWILLRAPRTRVKVRARIRRHAPPSMRNSADNRLFNRESGGDIATRRRALMHGVGARTGVCYRIAARGITRRYYALGYKYSLVTGSSVIRPAQTFRERHFARIRHGAILFRLYYAAKECTPAGRARRRERRQRRRRRWRRGEGRRHF